VVGVLFPFFVWWVFKGREKKEKKERKLGEAKER